MQVIDSNASTVRSGYLDPAAPPAAVIESGETVQCRDTWTHWGNEAVFGMTLPNFG